MWDSKYTTNINVQMNYWPVETCGLSELHDSLFFLIRAVCEKGKGTARIMYGMRGSVCHHNTDFYGDTAPQDQYMASTGWTAGGAWMAMHLWEHYLFTPVTRIFCGGGCPACGVAIFFVDFLTEDGEGLSGHLPVAVTGEGSLYPPDGYDTPICAGPAMDSQILRDLFSACIQADELLGQEDDWTQAFRDTLKRLPPDKIGSRGQLLEWREELPEKMPGMSHISHLYASIPARRSTGATPRTLMKAVRSIDIRVENGTDGGGWPLAWRICQYARLLDSETLGRAVPKMISQATDSFLNGRRIFQIDGNLEALLQASPRRCCRTIQASFTCCPLCRPSGPRGGQWHVRPGQRDGGHGLA